MWFSAKRPCVSEQEVKNILMRSVFFSFCLFWLSVLWKVLNFVSTSTGKASFSETHFCDHVTVSSCTLVFNQYYA